MSESTTPLEPQFKRFSSNKSIYDKWWFWLLLVVFCVGFIASCSGSDTTSKTDRSQHSITPQSKKTNEITDAEKILETNTRTMKYAGSSLWDVKDAQTIENGTIVTGLYPGYKNDDNWTPLLISLESHSLACNQLYEEETAQTGSFAFIVEDIEGSTLATVINGRAILEEEGAGHAPEIEIIRTTEAGSATESKKETNREAGIMEVPAEIDLPWTVMEMGILGFEAEQDKTQ